MLRDWLAALIFKTREPASCTWPCYSGRHRICRFDSSVLPPLADRNDVIHFQVDRPLTFSTTSSVAHQHCRAHAVGHAPIRKAVLPGRLFHLREVDEVGERAQVQRLGRPDQPLQLDGTVGQEIVHSRRKQQQTDQVGLVGVGKLTETDVVQQLVGQLDLSYGCARTGGNYEIRKILP